MKNARSIVVALWMTGLAAFCGEAVITLNANAHDPDNGQTLEYRWEKVSGPGTVKFAVPPATPNLTEDAFVSTPVRSASFDAAGVYTLKLTVRDNLGASSSRNMDVTVLDTQPPAAVEFLGTDTISQGGWRGRYGADGYDIVGAGTHLPSYATMDIFGNTFV